MKASSETSAQMFIASFASTFSVSPTRRPSVRGSVFPRSFGSTRRSAAASRNFAFAHGQSPAFESAVACAMRFVNAMSAAVWTCFSAGIFAGFFCEGKASCHQFFVVTHHS